MSGDFYRGEKFATPEPELWVRHIGPSGNEYGWMVYRAIDNISWFVDEEEARAAWQMFHDAWLEEKQAAA